MLDDKLKTKAQKVRVKKEAGILALEEIDAARKELQKEGGSTSDAPLPETYRKRFIKDAKKEVLILLKEDEK